MKRITFTAPGAALDRASEVARSEGKTLETAFREWLRAYASRVPEQYSRASKKELDALFQSLRYVRAGRKFTRDEMNER